MKHLLSLGLLLSLTFGSVAFGASGNSVIIRCDGNCDAAVNSVQSAGGTIVYRYKYVDALAARVPDDRYGELGSWNGVRDVYKDLPSREPRALMREDVGSAQPVGTAALGKHPFDYLDATLDTGVGPLFGDGHTGDGVKVAIIDSGTAEVPAFSRDGCATGPTTVIGGETYIASATTGEPSATSTANGSHGTWVGTTIAGNALFGFPSGNLLAQSVSANMPGSAFDLGGGVTGIPMIGTAPCAQIYALKVFKAAGGGAPTSDVAAAMERAIELRDNYNNGMPSAPVSGDGTPDNPYVYDSLDIQVVNMSLGGPTLFAGMDIDDILTRKMLDEGITIVISAGNEGFAAMTGGSAGTGRGALTAGAVNLAGNERVLRDLQRGLGAGVLYRPTDHPQIAYFSSRGPSADGRISTDAVANGFANFVMGPTSSISLVSGTSFSSPTIAGAAATLHGAVPGASGLQVRNALVETANPDFLGDDSAPIDQGHGMIDAAAAYAALEAGTVSNDLPSGPGSNSVKGNIASAGIHTIQLGNAGFATHIGDLVPGHVAHFFFQVSPDVEALQIGLINVDQELPPGSQNAFFGDDLFVKVQDSLTSDVADILPGSPFIPSDTVRVVPNPHSGIVRVAVMGDWTNAGRISTDLVVRAVTGKTPKVTDHGKLAQGDSRVLNVEVPAGTAEAHFELRWNQDWGAYPTDDLDMIVFDPNGNPIFESTPDGPVLPAATLNSPERQLVDSPAPGTYVVLLQGFTVWGDRGNDSQYSFRAFDENGKAF